MSRESEGTLQPLRPTDIRPENALFMKPSDARCLFRRNGYSGYTSGFCSGYAQTNVLILPKKLADDFEKLCGRNSGAFPLLYRSEAGEVGAPPLAVDSDIRVDLPQYVIYSKGVNNGNLLHLNQFDNIWNDYVSFYLGCSSTFDTALVENGVELKNLLDIPMYTSNISLCPVGPFEGKLTVSMRMIAKHQMVTAFMISSQYPDHHGAPIHIGNPSRIGISDTEVQDGYVPMFWACGFTVQDAIASAKPPLTFSHYPGSMFITDVKVEPITLDDTVEIVELSRPSDDYFASVINHNSLAIFDDLESILLDNHNGQERRVVTELSSNSDLLKATLTLSHAEKLVIVTTSSQFNVKGEIIHAISGTLALCQAFISLGKEVTLIIDEGDEKLYSSCIEHMVEIGAFKSGMLPAIVIENKLCETFEQSPSVYDCILAIEGAGPTCSGTPKIYNLSPLVHELYEMLCTNARHNIKIIRVSDIRGDESGLRQEKSASADYHIVAGNSDWVGYALACGLYVASTSPFHWRYRNYAINADKPPQFNVLEFLPSIEQTSSLWKCTKQHGKESKVFDQVMDLQTLQKKLSDITALVSGVHVHP